MSGRRFVTWLIRLAVMTVVYVAVANIIIDSAEGWGRLGRFGAAIGFGIHLFLVWAIAIAITSPISSAPVRFLVHSAAMLLLFAGAYLAISGGILGTTPEFLWRDVEPFALLIAGVIIVDAIVGFLLECWLMAAPRPAA